MTFGRLFNVGGCMALIVSAQHRRKLGWIIGQNVTASIEGEALVIRNVEKQIKAVVSDRAAGARGARTKPTEVFRRKAH